MLENVVEMNQYFAKTRLDRFLEFYILNGFHNVYRAALKAGYAETTARAQGRRILDTALRKTFEKIQLSVDNSK